MRLDFGNHHYNTPYRYAWEHAVNNPNLGVDGNNKTQTYITLGSIPQRRLFSGRCFGGFWAAAARAPPICHASKWERIAHLLIIMLYHGDTSAGGDTKRRLAEQRLWSNGMRWWHCELLAAPPIHCRVVLGQSGGGGRGISNGNVIMWQI